MHPFPTYSLIIMPALMARRKLLGGYSLVASKKQLSSQVRPLLHEVPWIQRRDARVMW